MKKLSHIISFILLFFIVLHHTQAQAPSVQITAKQKSGLFGMGSPKFMEIALSNQAKSATLSSDNVGTGKYYYFLCRAIGDWDFDADYVKDDLPKLSIEQGTQKFRVLWKEDLQKESKTLQIGFSKNLQMSQPLTITIELGKGPEQKELKIPEELWPGYSLFQNLSSQAESLSSVKKYRDAIQLYNKILGNNDLKIFSGYPLIGNLRTQVFGRYYDETFRTLSFTATQVALAPKDKISQIDQYIGEFQFIVDSLPSITLQINATDSGVSPLIALANKGLGRAKVVHDSIQVTFDEQNTKWIVDGNLSGEYSYKYQRLIPILTNGFTSLDFGDVNPASLKINLTDEMRTSLTKYNLGDPFDAFLRICNARLQRRQSIFPNDFLTNLRRDSSIFSMPYHSMLKSIDDFYKKDFANSKNELTKALRSCDNLELLPRLHQLRILNDINLSNAPIAAINHLKDAKLAESQNQQQVATDHYQQAIAMAPNFAYAVFAYAQYFMNAGDATRAITFFKRTYLIDKYFIAAYREAYNYYTKSGNFALMIEILSQALQNGNDYWEVNYYLGSAYMGTEPAKSIPFFEHALTLNPKSYQTTIQLGIAHQTTKNYSKAREYFNRCIELEPERQEAVDYLKNLDELMRTGR